MLLLSFTAGAQETIVKYLSGTGSDNTVEWEFRCSAGMNSGHWTTIQVPSCWELQGFGGYNYGWDENPNNEQGQYRHKFTADKEWKGKRVFLTFEGVMTDATARLNGHLAGPTHQGAFYRFQYEVTNLLNYGGENLLEVSVDKESSNKTVNEAERRADYWLFGGIFRPVYLEIKPEAFIERVAIDARHTGDFQFQAFPDIPGDHSGVSVQAEIRTLSGNKVAGPFKASGISPDGAVTLAGHFDSPRLWTSETPNLYQAVFYLKKGRKTLHEYRQRFGFRTAELRHNDGFYVNGVKVLFKGVCRHTFWPETGRTISPALALEDVRLIKEMNMNAVRMSHYPPDSYFLDYCDSLGLYVLDEIAGWQSIYDTPTAHRLVGEMIRRDVNHPSIVMWDNGNEGGFNTDIRRDYAIWDPQHRHLVEPFSKLDGMDTHHYPRFSPSLESVSKGDLVYMPTESLHGLYDGGHGAGLEDYWELLREYPLYAGQFLWDFADEGVVRRDLRDSIDAEGISAPDGILGPHHEKEGSFYTIKQVWSPVYVREPRLDASFDGRIEVENRYHFTNLSQCSFHYELVSYASPLDTSVTIAVGGALGLNVAPGAKGVITIPLPDNWREFDALRIKVLSLENDEIVSWSWPVSGPEVMAGRLLKGSSKKLAEKDAESLVKKLNPRIVGNPLPKDAKVDWSLENGLLRIDYQYLLDGDYDYAGIGLTYPEVGVTGAVLRANGPYRVWKNRLKGPEFGVFSKTYNNTITSQNWDYPEFKGYYSGFQAVKIHSVQTADLTVIVPDEGRYLQLFTPEKPVEPIDHCHPAFPEADVSVLDIIPAIGTKFSSAAEEGPQGAKEHCVDKLVKGTVFILIDN